MDGLDIPALQTFGQCIFSYAQSAYGGLAVIAKGIGGSLKAILLSVGKNDWSALAELLAAQGLQKG